LLNKTNKHPVMKNKLKQFIFRSNSGCEVLIEKQKWSIRETHIWNMEKMQDEVFWVACKKQGKLYITKGKMPIGQNVWETIKY